MFLNQLSHLTLDSVDSPNSMAIPGYRKYVLYSTQEYGISVGDFSSKTMFGFVVYKPTRYNLGPIRVELKLVVSTGENTYRLHDIDPEIIRNLIETSDLENKPVFVREGDFGHFLRFEPSRSTSSTNIKYILTRSSAGYFLDMLGNELALMLKGNDKIRNAKDARQVNNLLIDVNAFAKEMDQKAEIMWSTMTYQIKWAQKMYDKYKEKIARLESNMNFAYKRIYSGLDVLSSYGIDESEIDYL